MGKVCFSMTMSLDAYVEDSDGSIDFSHPDDEVHQLANENTRHADVFLFGRRVFEIMEEPWTAIAAQDDAGEVEKEFARIYFDTPRIVFSDSLEEVPPGVRLVRRADSVAEVQRLKQEVDGELHIGGPDLVASLIDLVDEFRIFVAPVTLGGGKPYFPPGRRLGLRLLEERRFASGTVYLRYAQVR